MHLGSLPYLCTKIETIAPLHVVTLIVQRELPNMHLGSLPYLCTKIETMAPLHVATLIVQRVLPILIGSVPRIQLFMAPLHVAIIISFNRLSLYITVIIQK